jgi:preprotein translocase subunit SecG
VSTATLTKVIVTFALIFLLLILTVLLMIKNPAEPSVETLPEPNPNEIMLDEPQNSNYNYESAATIVGGV